METNPFLLFLVTALTALAVENVVFARALGLNRATLSLKSARAGILYGAVLTWLAVLSSMLVTVVNYVLFDYRYAQFIRAPLFLLCVALVYAPTHLLTKRYKPALFERIEPVLPVSAFNSALFGVFYVAYISDFGFVQTVGYAFGSGIGYTIALQIIFYARKRLSISPIPRSFRGLPILLVYIGLLSLAIYGLIGYGLSA